ncbi:acyltransferase family protein [Paractinoplanes maris]|uniref:acyltransferase family protein n=1 Tax=Paractinoplanes maris TaxID=1734446 RepID=UPI002021F20A|nr:acyltransferase family protein [Actinoplanes maris]
MSGRGPSWGHLPALDGIRAFAVLSVVLFHAGIAGLAGGFLGVDTFFVLSGFLITSLLLAERRRTGRIDLIRFWVRRIRRLLPALLAMLLATVVAGRFLLDSDALALVRTDAYAALGYLANWRMIFRGTGYAAVTAAPSPLQHTWSLGIEEQFYLLWPLIVAALTIKLTLRRARTVLVVLCAAGAAASAVLCAWLYRPESISRAYYGTDTRAQALLIGALLAGVLAYAESRRPGGRAALGVTALLGAGVTGWLWHSASETAPWMYQGGLTVAALATAAVIAHVVVSPAAPMARFLGLAPLAALGRISYGVYLWHWPVFLFVTADATGLSRWPLLVVRLAGTLAVAVLSYHLIEQPIRHGALTGWRPTAVTVGALGVLIAVIGYATVPAVEPAPADAPVIAISVAPAPAVPGTPRRSRTPAPVVPINRPGRPGSAGNEPRITFFGDSVSWTIGTYLPPHPGMWTSVRSIQGCGIATLPRIRQLDEPFTNYPGCPAWESRWRKGVARDNPDVAVINLNRWELMDRYYEGRYQHVGDPGYDAYLLRQLDKAVTIAGSRGAAVVLLTASYTRRAERPDGSLYPEDRPERVDAWNRLLRAEAARRPGRITVLDLNPVVCPGGEFTWRVNRLKVRSDGLHYTPSGVQRVIAPWLLPKLAAVAAGTYRAPGQQPALTTPRSRRG